jgi:hypothetical protein
VVVTGSPGDCAKTDDVAGRARPDADAVVAGRMHVGELAALAAANLARASGTPSARCGSTAGSRSG